MSSPPADFAGAFMADYFAECEEHLIAVRRGLLTLESAIGAADPPAGLVDDLFRSFHSLKGLSAMVALRDAERLAHDLESCLRAIRQREVVLSNGMLDALVGGVQALEEVIGAKRAGAEAPSIRGPLDRLADASRGAVATAASPAASSVGAASDAALPSELWRVTFTPSADLVARGIKVDSVRARLSAVGRIQSVAPRVLAGGGIAFDFQVAVDDGGVFAGWRADGIGAERLPQTGIAPPPPSASGVSPGMRPVEAAVAPTNFVRVDLARLDDLMRLVGDLVVARARLADALQRVERYTPTAEWRTLQEHSGSIERHLRDLREGVMRVRLVTVGEIFRRMPFVVRDLARDTGRRVKLDLAGQATEIDKFLIERLMDPVLHLVRNAISHGIEPPDERIAAGKPPDGTIRLSAATMGASVVLEVADDGRGMDAAAIAQRARGAGMDVPETLDARALLEVITSPGFSTRDAADRASGRGVGMSVVRDAVAELGGAMSVTTEPGRGTTFQLVVPLTLAITDALIVQVGDRRFAVPQSAVREVGEIDMTSVRVIESHELVMHRGAPLPVVRLARLFGFEESPRPRMHVIVVGAETSATGILVDRITGQREIVVKTLSDPMTKVPGVSGATELGDGRLILILEPAALAALAALPRKGRAAAPGGRIAV